MKLTNFLRFSFAKHARYCIIGGGQGGLGLSTHLLKSGIPPTQITVIDPSPYHYYQPGWSQIGAGLTQIVGTVKQMDKTFPSKIKVQRDSVKLVKPKENLVLCSSGQEFTYDQLILCSGVQVQYFKIEGLKEALDDPNSKVCTIYDLKYAQKTAKLGANLKQGKAIFTEPRHPIKCGGAPQKILYMWYNKWTIRRRPIQIQFIKADDEMFIVPKYSKALQKLVALYGIKVTFMHKLMKVKGNEATFENRITKQLVTRKFDFLHAVPPMGPHPYIAESGLADENGYVNLDKHTLRHKVYKNIWGIGDCTSLPTSKTASATFQQVVILHDNLLAVRRNPSITNLPARYEGYSGCPLIVAMFKAVLAEFKYDKVIDQTFYNNQQKPRFQFYLLKRIYFPIAYWLFVPRGMWKGRKGIRWF